MVRLVDIKSVCPCGLNVLKQYFEPDIFDWTIGHLRKTNGLLVRTCKEQHGKH